MAFTKEQVLKIQENGIDWLGNPLVADGIYGAKTAWWHGISGLSQKRQDVLRLALGYHATDMGEATGRNDGEFVDTLFKPVGLQKRGFPWCVAFISHCLTKCEVPWPIYHVSAYNLIEWAKANNIIVEDPWPADLEVFLYPKVKGEDWRGHGRIVTGYSKKTGRTSGVDGNVNNSVYCGFRDVRPDRYFVRPDYEAPLTLPIKLPDLDKYGDR